MRGAAAAALVLPRCRQPKTKPAAFGTQRVGVCALYRRSGLETAGADRKIYTTTPKLGDPLHPRQLHGASARSSSSTAIRAVVTKLPSVVSPVSHTLVDKAGEEARIDNEVAPYGIEGGGRLGGDSFVP